MKTAFPYLNEFFFEVYFHPSLRSIAECLCSLSLKQMVTKTFLVTLQSSIPTFCSSWRYYGVIRMKTESRPLNGDGASVWWKLIFIPVTPQHPASRHALSIVLVFSVAYSCLQSSVWMLSMDPTCSIGAFHLLLHCSRWRVPLLRQYFE